MAVLAVDPHGDIAFWSARAESMFGYVTSEVLGRPAAMLVASDQQPVLHEEIVRAQNAVNAALPPRRFDARRRNGSSFPAAVLIECWDIGGQPIVAAAFHDLSGEESVLDITFRVSTLLAINSSFAEAAPRLLEVISDALACEAGAIWLPDRTGEALQARYFWPSAAHEALRDVPNIAFRRGVGLPGRVWSEGRAQSEETERGLHAAAFPIAAGGAAIGVLELFSLSGIDLDGTRLQLMTSIGAQMGMALERENALAALRRLDVQDRDAAQAADLQTLRRRFEDAERMSRIGSFERNLRTGQSHWSDQLFRILGLEPQSRTVDFEYALSLVVSEEREMVRAAVEDAIRDRRRLDLQYHVAAAAGPRALRARAGVVSEPDGEPRRWVGAVVDITEDEDVNVSDLHRQIEEGRRLGSLGRMAASMAHEFNNVLMGIDSFAEVLRRRLDGEQNQAAIKQIRQSTARGRRITDEILRYTRSASPIVAPIDIRPWLHDFLAEATALTAGKVTVRLHAPEDLTILGDVSQLNQVLANLVLNARDASREGQEVIIGARRSFQRTGCVDLFVTDQGSGMPAEVRERIFEPLFTTKRSGTGLGLAIVHQIVTAHNGIIRVNSEPGKGTSFNLFLPLASAEQQLAKKASAPMPANVLIVEDDAAVADGLAALLEMEGLRPRIVYTGGEVVAALREEPADVVVLDISLPDMSGIDVYLAVSQIWPALPIIFVTGDYDPEKVARYLLLPHVAVLRKPFDSEQLLNALARVTRQQASGF